MKTTMHEWSGSLFIAGIAAAGFFLAMTAHAGF